MSHRSLLTFSLKLCLVKMKNSLVIVFLALSLVHILGWNHTPNVQLNFATITSDPSIEYTVLPLIKYNYDQTIISLKAVQLGSCEEYCWFIYFTNITNIMKRSCEHLIITAKELSPKWQDFYDIKPLQHEGHSLEIFKVFSADINLNIFFHFLGCKNIPENNKMSKMELLFIVYKHGNITAFKLWDTSFTFYKKIYGVLKFANEEDDDNSTEFNGVPINYNMMFCPQTEDSLEEKKFDYKPNEKHTQKTYGLFIVVATIIAIFIIFLIFSKYTL